MSGAPSKQLDLNTPSSPTSSEPSPTSGWMGKILTWGSGSTVEKPTPPIGEPKGAKAEDPLPKKQYKSKVIYEYGTPMTITNGLRSFPSPVFPGLPDEYEPSTGTYDDKAAKKAQKGKGKLV